MTNSVYDIDHCNPTRTYPYPHPLQWWEHDLQCRNQLFTLVNIFHTHIKIMIFKNKGAICGHYWVWEIIISPIWKVYISITFLLC